jgi:hypothetical protein
MLQNLCDEKNSTPASPSVFPEPELNYPSYVQLGEPDSTAAEWSPQQ